MSSLFTRLTLVALVIAFLLSGCQPAAVSPIATSTNVQTITPITPRTPPLTPRLTPAPASAQAPTPDQNRIAATIHVSSPSSIAAADGLIWVNAGGSVVRIDPQANQVVAESIPAGSQAEDIALGDNALWVTTVGSGDLGAPSDIDAVSRIDPATGETVATIKVSRGPMSLAVTPGAVWVVNFGIDGDTVTRIDSKTNQIVGEPIETGRAPLSIAIGGGAVWVANHDAHTVTRLDPITNQVIANIPVPSEPHRVAYGADAVWVSNWHNNSVSRIDPQTNQVVGEPIPIGFPAGNIAVGHGSVWVTSDYRVDGDPEDVVVVRIDPQTNQAVETIPVGGHPIDLAVTEDAVWVSVQNADMIVKINP